MQLDRTRIAVRERSGIELMDMSLLVLRAYFRPVWQAALLGAAPFMAINAVLLWGLWINPDDAFPWRYFWLMTVLVFLQAPWAGAIITAYLGAAVFEEGISVRKAAQETWQRWPQMLWCQGFVRGVVPAMALILLARQSEGPSWFIEAFLLPVILIYSIALRAFRPFINEIVLLERNPLRAKNSQTITAGKRSKYLHDPSAGDLVMRWMGASLIAVLMVFALVQTVTVLVGLLFGIWTWSGYMMHVGYPIALWLTGGYMAVVRFLNYLDLRIRHEGWEVELRLRAEAVRLASKLT
jgi:hypothetical protein